MKDKSLDDKIFQKKQNLYSHNKTLGNVVHSPIKTVNIYVAPKVKDQINERKDQQKQIQKSENNLDLIQDFGSFPYKEEIKNPTFNME